MHRLRCLILLLAAILGLAVSSKAQQVIQISYVGNFAPIAVGLPFSTVFSVNNYYIIPIAPGNGVYFYVTRHGANALDQVQLHMRVTGSQITPGANCPGTSTGWSNQNTQGLTTGVDTTFGINHTLVFSGAINDGILASGIVTGAQICLQVGATSSTADTFDIFAVFNPNATPAGSGLGLTTPLCSGAGAAGFSAPLGVGVTYALPCDNSTGVGGGIYIGSITNGSVGQNVGTQIAVQRASSINAALVVAPCFFNSNTGCLLGGASGNFAQAASILVTSGGWYQNVPGLGTITASGQQILNSNVGHGVAGIANACTVDVEINGPVTGTGPTIQFFFQDSNDLANWADRISFPIMSGITRSVATVVTGTAGIPPYTPSVGTLTAGSIVNGPIRSPVRLQWIVGGTTPSFGGVTVNMDCT
jgi:hypothetical protein